jgi:thiamine-monophosphate kinase
MLPLAGRFGVELVGGDTNAWDGPLVISVTVLGEATGQGPVRRAGARAGDVILVTGPLGGSLLGRHLRPEPRIAEALALHAAAPIRAMIDLSDGLASDLGHILDESGRLGAVLEAGAIPVHPDARAASHADGRSPLDHALNDGEDFELCLVVDPEAAELLTTVPATAALVTRIGTVLDRQGLWLRSDAGGTSPLERRGFDHFRFRTGSPVEQKRGE